MSRPHHPTPEAIELTEGEKDKIMNDFLLPEPNASVLDFSTKTLDELHVYGFALAIAYEKCKGPFMDTTNPVCDALKELSAMVDQAIKDTQWEGQQLPWKD